MTEKVPHLEEDWLVAGYTDWPHFLRVQCDFAADGLWAECGGAYDLSYMPLSEDTKQMLRDWEALYDESSPEIAGAYCNSEEYVETGRVIARAVKRELPRCLVVSIDRRMRADGSLGERVPWPGEATDDSWTDRGAPFAKWKAAALRGDFPD